MGKLKRAIHREVYGTGVLDMGFVDWILGAGLPAGYWLLRAITRHEATQPFRHAAQIISRVFPEPVG